MPTPPLNAAGAFDAGAFYQQAAEQSQAADPMLRSLLAELDALQSQSGYKLQPGELASVINYIKSGGSNQDMTAAGIFNKLIPGSSWGGRGDGPLGELMKRYSTLGDRSRTAQYEGDPNAATPGAGAAAGQPGDVDQRAAITAQIQDFYKRMTMPVTDAAGNITEPVVKQLATIGRSMGLQGASGSGIQGGAASAAGSASAMSNALPYLQQRASLAAGANQLLQNGQLGYEASNQGLMDLNRRAQEMQNDVTQANYQNSVNRAQGTASTLGGVVGALAEFGLGIPGATKIGTNLAASLGGQTVAPPTYAPYKQNTGGAA